MQDISSDAFKEYKERGGTSSLNDPRNSLGVMVSPLDGSIYRAEGDSSLFQPPQSVSSITKNDDPEVSFTSNEMSIRNEMARRQGSGNVAGP